jgi:excisionase family DNA binding protein
VIDVADGLLTVDEVSDRLKLKPKTVRAWISDGKIKAEKWGYKTIRVRESELERHRKEAKA